MDATLVVVLSVTVFVEALIIAVLSLSVPLVLWKSFRSEVESREYARRQALEVQANVDRLDAVVAELLEAAGLEPEGKAKRPS